MAWKEGDTVQIGLRGQIVDCTVMRKWEWPRYVSYELKVKDTGKIVYVRLGV